MKFAAAAVFWAVSAAKSKIGWKIYQRREQFDMKMECVRTYGITKKSPVMLVRKQRRLGDERALSKWSKIREQMLKIEEKK